MARAKTIASGRCARAAAAMRSAASRALTVTTKARARAAPTRARNSGRPASPKKHRSPATLAHQLAIGIEGNERYILGGEQTRHRLADAAIAADHHMILHLARVLRWQ